VSSVGAASWGGQLLAHAQARLAADQARQCAPCTLKEDQKAVDMAQDIAAAEAGSASASGGQSSASQGVAAACGPQCGRLVDITV
jgi:hypothetical protein